MLIKSELHCKVQIFKAIIIAIVNKITFVAMGKFFHVFEISNLNNIICKLERINLLCYCVTSYYKCKIYLWNS